MAAFAALVSLMNNMEQIMSHPRLSKCFDDKQIQSLLEKAGFLLSIIEGNKYGGGSKEAEDLERQITCAAHAAEDVIESHIVDQILAGSTDYWKTRPAPLLAPKESQVVKNMVRDWERRIASAAAAVTARVPVVRQIHAGTVRSLDLQHLIQDMDAVVEKVMEAKEREGSREEQQPIMHSRPLIDRRETAMVGLDDELTQLLDSLTDHHSNRHVISIVGMGGTGKTTLANNLYADPLVIEHFDIRAWAAISQQYDVKEILSLLLSCLGKDTDGGVGELGEQLHKSLIGRRYLIILDDIWSVEAWDKVRCYFPDDGKKSRVVLTTRLSNVASVCASTCFNLNLLDEDKSWKLFCEKVLFPQKDDPLQLEDVAKKIAKSCKGLALSIVVIGGLLLKSPRTVGYWENVLKGLEKTDSKEKQQGLDALSLSYDHLPPHLKPCFLYMGVFDEDSEIRVSNITRLWVAEGFIKPNDTRVPEEIAEVYLNDLIDRNLIIVNKHRRNGKIGSCSIHDLLRDLCIKVANQQGLFHVRKYGPIRDGDRRFVCNPLESIESPLVRSIIGMVFFVGPSKCKLLRVLGDVKGAVRDLSVGMLYCHLNLRHLAYEHPYDSTYPMWRLPTSATLLWNLQTLIINRKFQSTQIVMAPSEIWKMRQLRHVKCPLIYLPTNSSDVGLDCLENLQTLKTAVNLGLSEEMYKMIPNIKKLGLLYIQEDDSSFERPSNLDRLLKLESLSMSIKLRNVEKLAFPTSLKKLSLSHCRLCWEDLKLIGSLPRLQVLSLEKDSVTEGERWSPVDGQFRQLKFLKIDQCELLYWDADCSHFPVLEKLLLIRLGHLEEIPLEMGEIPELGLIRLVFCSQSAAISAMRIKEHQLEYEVNDALQIQARISRSDFESFKISVEAEQLKLNYIQLEAF